MFRNLKKPSFGIRARTIFLVTTVLVAALIVINIVWFTRVRSIITEQNEASQTQLGERAKLNIEEFINAKIRTLIVHSQTASFFSQDRTLQLAELTAFFLQDRDVTQLTVIGTDGIETLKLTPEKEFPADQLEDRSDDPAFAIPSFAYGIEYVGEIYYKEDGRPYFTISVPIAIPYYRNTLTNITTTLPGERRQLGDILGVLEAEISLEGLFGELTNISEETGATVYVIDRNGRVIAHPNTAFVIDRFDASTLPSVAQHIATIMSSTGDSHDEERVVFEYDNLEDIRVFGTHAHISPVKWGVIVEQPTDTILAGLNNMVYFVGYFLLAGLFVSVLVAIWFSRQLTDPIITIAKGAQQLGKGDLRHRIQVNTKGELRALAQTLNGMAERLQKSRVSLEHDRNVIEAERNKISVVVENIVDGVIALDREGRVTLFNSSASEIIGVNQDEAVGQKIDTVLQLYDENDDPITSATYLQEKSSEEDPHYYYHGALHLDLENDQQRIVSLTAAGIESEGTDDLEVTAILLLHDITEEEELERMKLDFVSMAAHELRTPLTTLRGYLSLLQDEKVTNKLGKEDQVALNRTMASAVRLNNLIENLLNVSRIERGEMKVNKEPMQLESVIRSIVNEFVGLATSKNLSLTFHEPDDKLPLVNADKFRIGEVLGNLIGNALNYTQKGSVDVSVYRKDDEIVTEVKDTGQGIPEEAIEHLFTKFFRVQGELQSGSKGTGLGLFLSKKIIETHGGRIWLESTLHEGSTFYFSLPIATDD